MYCCPQQVTHCIASRISHCNGQHAFVVGFGFIDLLLSSVKTSGCTIALTELESGFKSVSLCRFSYFFCHRSLVKLLQEWVEESNLEKCTAHPSRPWKLTGNEIIPLLAIKPDMGERRERWLVLLFLNIIISFLFHFNGLGFVSYSC